MGSGKRTTGKGEKEREVRERERSKVWMEETETNHEEPIRKLGGCNAATNRLAQVAAWTVDWKQGREDEPRSYFL